MEVVTLIIKVDLNCCRCRAKIQKVLCKLQKCEPIQEIVYDGKDTVTVSGPFDPDCLIRKIRCKAGKIIICIKLKPPPSPPSTPSSSSSSSPSPSTSPPPSPPPVKVVEWNWPKDPPPWFKPCPCCKGHQGCGCKGHQDCCCKGHQGCGCKGHQDCCCKGHHGCCSCGNLVNVMPQLPAPVCGGGGVTIVCNDDPAPGCNIM